MNKFLFLSHFSGCGGSAVGAKQCGFELVGAIEIEPKIFELYRANLGENILLGDITKFEPKIFELPSEKERRRHNQILVLQTSPPCQEFSLANKKRNLKSTRASLLTTTYDWYKQLKPEYVVLENVQAYRNSKPYLDFENFLLNLGYSVYKFCINSADFGVPQTRVRFISIATKRGYPVPIITATHASNPSGQINLFEPSKFNWVSWYDAIQDLLPNLKELKLSDNQLKVISHYNLDNVIIDRCKNNTSANSYKFRKQHQPCLTLTTETKLRVLLDTNNVTSTVFGNKIRLPNSPSFTLCTKGAPKVVTNDYVSLKLDTQALARIQSFPDWYEWGASQTTCHKAIGNSVAPLVMQRICEAIRAATLL